MSPLVLAGSILMAIAAASPAGAAVPATTLSFDGVTYIHRWSSQGQNEYTPQGDEDLKSWKSMLTVNVHDWARDGEQLAELANRVLGNYQATAKVLRTDSKPRTKEREAEHFAAVLFTQPTFIEAAFARILMAEGRGVVVVYSKRFYGSAVGNEMSAWLGKNGVAVETALMAWKGLPPLAELASLPQAKATTNAAATPVPETPAPKAGALSKTEAIGRLKALGYPRPADADQFVGSALQGNRDVVELFLAAGMPVDTPNRLGDHAFLMSIKGGYIEIAEELLKAGADPSLPDENGITPLIELAKYCDEGALFRAILAKGVDVKVRSRGGQTALSEANDHDCRELARLLKKAGAVR